VSKYTWLFTSHTLSILFDAPLRLTKCASRTIALTGTVYIISVWLTMWMNPSIQSAQWCKSFFFVGITTIYSWAWEQNIHYWVFLHLLEQVDIIVPVGTHFWNRRNRFDWVQLNYNTGKVGTWPWNVLLRSRFIYWTQISWHSGMISWLASVYSTLQLSHRRWTDIEQWNGWQ